MANQERREDASGEAAAEFFLSDINMQHAESSYHSNKMTNFISPSSYYHHHQLHNHQSSSEIGGGVVFGSESGGGTEASGKVLFTATQWQELERQTMIYKCIMASIPVPPQLLIPLSTQSNKGGMDLRFSSVSDLEPWRCRRTDGKKWRCSRDVAPDQKYCERHAHKTRPRSRKPVENITTAAAAINITPTAYTSSYQHPRCNEWFVKSGTIPVSSSNQQFHQSMNSPRVGSKRNHFFPQDFEESHQQNEESHLKHSNFQLDTTSARRQHFIDAWSRSGGGGDNCSLTLSMQCSGSGGMDDDDDDRNFQMGVGMLNDERGESGDVFKSHNQWLNQSSWMSSPPGGPLGEALGLGIASTTTSSSCENGGSHGHELSFIR